MEELTYLEQKIIAAIAETHPYAIKEVEMVYRRCKSFDNTIKILEESHSYAVSLTYKLTGMSTTTPIKNACY